MAEPGGLALDFLKQIINVHWAEAGVHFLYSGADGMYGSKTGTTWKKAPASVAAASLAWVDDIWVGCGPGGCWRSEDGAKTWKTVSAPEFVEVVAMKPKGTGPDGKPKKGVFAAWLEDESGANHIVYTSHDLGQTWSVVLSIPTTVGENGLENINGLSGCGGALFVCTSFRSQVFHHGDGNIYSSIDGHSFASETVFGFGTITLPDDPDQFPRIGYGANAVGYDEKTKTYMAICQKEIISAFGVQESYLVYSTSGSVSFGTSEGTIAESATQAGAGEFISVATSAAGGDGRHVTGLSLFRYAITSAFIDGQLEASFIPGESALVQTMGSHAGGYIGSFCFKSSEESTDGGSTDGDDVFACTAFDAEMAGGAYVATAGGGFFALRHGGTGIDIGGGPRGAVAVGKISFLGTAEPHAGL